MTRIPRHIGIIPDGNRRWAVARGLPKEAGYEAGLSPGLQVLRLCSDIGVKEVTSYGFTQDNTRRNKEQRRAFQRACINGVEILKLEDASLLVVGDADSPMFPQELRPYTKRTKFGTGKIKVNFLVNYGWEWDLHPLFTQSKSIPQSANVNTLIRSSDVSRIDLIIRWGGRMRLSGFLPVQSVYSDIYVVDAYWPDFKPEHFFAALDWYDKQDITLGG
jgi:undecaprenyl diphosphate synthase